MIVTPSSHTTHLPFLDSSGKYIDSKYRMLSLAGHDLAAVLVFRKLIKAEFPSGKRGVLR